MKRHHFYFAIILTVLGCGQKKKDKVVAHLIRNDVFTGYSISDQETTLIENGLKQLFENTPVKAVVRDTIFRIMEGSQPFKAGSNAVTIRFKGGIVKDSIDLTIMRSLNDRKRHDIFVIAEKNAGYNTISNTPDECIIQTKVISDALVIADDDPDAYYTLDTFNNNFYNKKRELLRGFRGFKSYSYPIIYIMSLKVYQQKDDYLKTITYDPAMHNGSGITSHMVRTDN